MRPEDWKIKNMLHSVSLQLNREELLKRIADDFNPQFMVELDKMGIGTFSPESDRPSRDF
jgi:hypothetical protein